MDIHPYPAGFCRFSGDQPGKTHYCLTELIKKGHVKASRFKNSRNKAAYAYVLTPQGFDEKLHLLMHFLRRKKNEYQLLEQEIAQLTQDLDAHSTTDPPDRPDNSVARPHSTTGCLDTE